MENMTARSELTIKQICAQLGFAASTVNAYCEKLSPDIFGKCRGDAEDIKNEFYSMSYTLSECADSVAMLADWLFRYAEREEPNPENAERLRKIVDISVLAAERFEDISVAIYSRISFNASMAVIDAAALRRDAAGFLVNIRNAITSISERR